MNTELYPYVPKYIVIRKYKDYNIYDLKYAESYIIDDEAFLVLKFTTGRKTIKDILRNFSKEKHSEVLEAFEQYEKLGIIKFDSNKLPKDKLVSTDHINTPETNPFQMPYLKNLMINITEKCNLTCKHCYITDKHQSEMELPKLTRIIRKFYDLQGIKLIITGGEPFLYSKMKELLTFLKNIPIEKVILSNGTLISDLDEGILKLMKENYVEVFISIDGLEKSHNDFRNANCFNESINGIKRLLDYGISVSINSMIHKQNLEEFDELFNLISSIGDVKNWSIDIPTFDDSTPEQVRKKYEVSYSEGGRILRDYGWGVIYESPTEGEKFEYACGPYLMAIDVLGNVTKCGFFSDQSVGNVFELGLKKSWKGIQKNLNWNIYDLKCVEEECEFLEECRGGCRYRAYRDRDDIMGIDSYKCFQYGKLKNE